MIDFAKNFDEDSKIWIYQSNRDFTPIETAEIRQKLKTFASQWTSHDTPLMADADVFLNRFIVFTVNTDHSNASGCSIDKSVAIVRQLENEYNIQLFDRLNLAWKVKDEIHSAHYMQFIKLIEEGALNSDTIIFNNTITHLKELKTHWQIPAKESWLMIAKN